MGSGVASASMAAVDQLLLLADDDLAVGDTRVEQGRRAVDFAFLWEAVGLTRR